MKLTNSLRTLGVREKIRKLINVKIFGLVARYSWRIFKFVLGLLIVSFFLLIILIYVASPTIGIKAYITLWFLVFALISFGIMGCLYERRKAYSLLNRKIGRDIAVILLFSILIVAAIASGTIRLFVHTKI